MEEGSVGCREQCTDPPSVLRVNRPPFNKVIIWMLLHLQADILPPQLLVTHCC